MVKITTRALKIGVQSRLYPISIVGFRTFFPENFGQAYCISKQKLTEVFKEVTTYFKICASYSLKIARCAIVYNQSFRKFTWNVSYIREFLRLLLRLGPRLRPL